MELLDWLNLAMLLCQFLGKKGFTLPMDIETSFNLRLGYLMPYHARLVCISRLGWVSFGWTGSDWAVVNYVRPGKVSLGKSRL